MRPEKIGPDTARKIRASGPGRRFPSFAAMSASARKVSRDAQSSERSAKRGRSQSLQETQRRARLRQLREGLPRAIARCRCKVLHGAYATGLAVDCDSCLCHCRVLAPLLKASASRLTRFSP